MLLNKFLNFFFRKNGQILILQYRYAHGFSSVKISHHQIIIVLHFQNLKNHFIPYSKIYLKKERNHLGNSGINETLLISKNWTKKLRNHSGLYQTMVSFFHCSSSNFIFQSKINSSHKFLYHRFQISKISFHVIFNLELIENLFFIQVFYEDLINNLAIYNINFYKYFSTQKRQIFCLFYNLY